MKRFILAATLAMLVLLSGCGKEPEAPSPEPELTGNIFLDAEQKLYSTQGGGVSMTISISKEDALAASADDYAEFVKTVLVRNKGHYEVVGISFGDGTGVTFFGSDPTNAVYGDIGYAGTSVEAYGFICPTDDGGYEYIPYDD